MTEISDVCLLHNPKCLVNALIFKIQAEENAPAQKSDKKLILEDHNGKGSIWGEVFSFCWLLADIEWIFCMCHLQLNSRLMFRAIEILLGKRIWLLTLQEIPLLENATWTTIGLGLKTITPFLSLPSLHDNLTRLSHSKAGKQKKEKAAL